MSGRGQRVLLALSGGVDSAACIRLLQGGGYDVHGLVLRFSEAHGAAVNAARITAREAGIPLEVHGCGAEFDAHVVRPFCDAYMRGLTPNPCAVCNPLVKFRQLELCASRAGIEHIASGHYARIVHKDGIYYVARAKSAARDQSYMLYRLPQSVLRRLLLPAGDLEKGEIRAIAASAGFSCAAAPDSQEICFVPEGGYADFVERRAAERPRGNFVGPRGENLGPHGGVWRYTVGQRRGLRLPLGHPVYVRRILPCGDVQLARGEDMLVSEIELGDCVFTRGVPPACGEALAVKVRSMARPVPCVFRSSARGGSCRIVFENPQRAPAPGQHAVLYSGPLVAGGGVIIPD